MKEAFKAQKASALLFFAFRPPCHSQRLVQHSYCHCHTVALSNELKLVSWQVSCTALHACLFLFCSLHFSDVCTPPTSNRYPASILILRDVGSDKRRKKISKMSSVISNTKCELSLFSLPPLVWLLSRAVTLAVLLGATPCQVEFRASQYPVTLHQGECEPQENSKRDGQKQ